MKRFFGVTFLVAVVPLAALGQVVLSAGDTYTYEFTHFDFQGSFATTPGARVGLAFREQYGFDGTDTFRFEAFETSTNEPALFSTNLTAGAGEPDFTFPSAWQNLHGIFRITMLSGSAVLPGFFGSVFKTNGFYSLKVDVSPRLNVTAGASQWQLRWTTNAAIYHLESTDDLRLSVWSLVTNMPSVNANEFVVDVGTVAGQRYFRLQRP